MAGLRPTECDQMVAVLREINQRQGMTILLIEHVMRAVMALAGQVIVLHHGEIIGEGSPAEVVRQPTVVASYLGETSDL
jgi:branched-chain amino acid transport system ATP-binding protein